MIAIQIEEVVTITMTAKEAQSFADGSPYAHFHMLKALVEIGIRATPVYTPKPGEFDEK